MSSECEGRRFQPDVLALTLAGTSIADGAATNVLDEPTTGVHLADTELLLGLLDRLVDTGHSVIIIEHCLAVMATTVDHRPGPGAGHDGGRVVFEGTPPTWPRATHSPPATSLRTWPADRWTLSPTGWCAHSRGLRARFPGIAR
jgi:excinuclease UvrABC ATPase subunit